MTKNRNIPRDQEITASILQQIAENGAPPTARPTWLGHGGQKNVPVDLALLTGSTLTDLDGISKKRALNHIAHLREDHGLTVEHRDGIYRFVAPN